MPKRKRPEEIEVEQGSEEWLKMRRGKGARIGASDSAAAIGASGYCLPKALYEVLTQKIDTHAEDNENIQRGHREEPKIIDNYKSITGFNVKKGNFWTHAKYPQLFS